MWEANKVTYRRMYQREIVAWEKVSKAHRVFLTLAAQNAQKLYDNYTFETDLIYNQLRLCEHGVVSVWLPNENMGRYVKWQEST